MLIADIVVATETITIIAGRPHDDDAVNERKAVRNRAFGRLHVRRELYFSNYYSVFDPVTYLPRRRRRQFDTTLATICSTSWEYPADIVIFSRNKRQKIKTVEFHGLSF